LRFLHRKQLLPSRFHHHVSTTLRTPLTLSQHVSQETQTPLAHPRLASHHRPLPLVSRQPLLSAANSQTIRICFASTPAVKFCPHTTTIDCAARCFFAKISWQVSKLSRSGRRWCDASTVPCRRIRHRHSTLPQFQYFMLIKK
jgi:hypothetical protein